MASWVSEETKMNNVLIDLIKVGMVRKHIKREKMMQCAGIKGCAFSKRMNNKGTENMTLRELRVYANLLDFTKDDLAAFILPERKAR